MSLTRGHRFEKELSLSTHHLSGAPRATNGQEAIAVEPTLLLRKLGPSASSTYLERVVGDDGAGQFIVVERTPRGTMTHEEVEASLADARLAATLEHPNVVRTRDISVTSEEIRVTSDYVAGERLSDLWSAAAASGKGIPFDVAIRILIDVATGLGALHHLRLEGGHERAKFVHGEITAANVLVGLDGTSSILRAARVRSADSVRGTGCDADGASAGNEAGRAQDIHALGGLLWQLLSGQPPAVQDDADKMLANAQRGPVARAIMRSAPWALPLGEVAIRALDPSVDKRFPTTSSMITEFRKIAGARLATGEQVAKFVETVAGDKIAARLRDVQGSAVMRKATSIPPAAKATSTPPVAKTSIPRLPSAPPSSKRSQRPGVVSTRSEIPRLPLPPTAAMPAIETPAAVDEDTEADTVSVVATVAAAVVPVAESPVAPHADPSRNAERVAPAVARSRRITPAMAVAGAVVVGVLMTVLLSAIAIHNRREIVTPASTSSLPGEAVSTVTAPPAPPIKAEVVAPVPVAAPAPVVAPPSSDEQPAKTSTTSSKKTRKQRTTKTPKK